MFNSFFRKVMHGGLFKRDDVKLDELRTIDRNRQPGEEGQYPPVEGRVSHVKKSKMPVGKFVLNPKRRPIGRGSSFI